MSFKIHLCATPLKKSIIHFTTMNQNKMFVFLFLALSCHLPLSISQNNNTVVKDGNTNVHSTNSTPLPLHNARRDDVRIFSSESYDFEERGRLAVDVQEITSSSFHVKWSLPERKFNDSVLEASIVCETSKGLMISKINATSRATYLLENLHADTSYFVCVYMLEKSHFSNTKVLHYSCHTLTTLDEHRSLNDSDSDAPYLRTDSIIAVALTLGYIIVMVIIGYVTWRWKKKLKKQDEAIQKLAIEEDDYEEDEGMINGHLRDTNKGRGGSGDRGGSVGGHGFPHNYRDIGGSGYGYSSSVDNLGGQKDSREFSRSSSRGLTNLDRGRGGGSRSNNVEAVAFSESDDCLQRMSNSAEEVNGCLEFKRHSRGSAVKLNDATGKRNSQEKNRPKSQSVEDSPVKVTEISF